MNYYCIDWIENISISHKYLICSFRLLPAKQILMQSVILKQKSQSCAYFQFLLQIIQMNTKIIFFARVKTLG